MKVFYSSGINIRFHNPILMKIQFEYVWKLYVDVVCVGVNVNVTNKQFALTCF